MGGAFLAAQVRSCWPDSRCEFHSQCGGLRLVESSTHGNDTARILKNALSHSVVMDMGWGWGTGEGVDCLKGRQK